MRLALLSDIHGNLIALNAVLADIEAQGGVDGYWVLGDLVALGYDPAGVLLRLTSLPHVHFTRGNADRYVTSDRPPPTLAATRDNPELLPTLVEVSQTFAWTQGYVTAGGWLDWLTALPLEQRLVLPDGTRLLGVHAAPGTDDGPGIRPTMTDADLTSVLDGCAADLVCVGHTHWPLDRQIEGIRVFNLGSVSNPYPPDLRASYAILDANTSGYELRHCRASYDPGAVIAAIEHVRHPGGAYITRFMRGEARPPWQVP
jgi:predicted phosphodiesterase